MRILLVSDAPWAPSGYGVQTKLLIGILRRLGHDVTVLAAYGLHGAPTEFDGVTVLPGGLDAFGNDAIGPAYHSTRADILITLKDVWVYRPSEWGDNVHWCPLVPVDHDPIPPGIASILRALPRVTPIAYSQFGLTHLARLGYIPLYAPHAYDGRVYAPMDRREARQMLGVPDDCFAIGMVAVNRGGFPSRKAWPQNLEGFARFRRHHPHARLYAHTHHGQDGREQAVNLVLLAEQLGISDAIVFADPAQYAQGYPESAMRAFYCAMDVVNTTSVGEGFGIPTLEAQACGTPVIVGDWCASSELLFAGVAIPKERAFAFYDAQASYIYLPEPDAIAAALATMVERCRDEGETLRERALIGAARYEVAQVTQDWRRVLSEIERLRTTRRRTALTIVRPEALGIDVSQQQAESEEIAWSDATAASIS